MPCASCGIWIAQPQWVRVSAAEFLNGVPPRPFKLDLDGTPLIAHCAICRQIRDVNRLRLAFTAFGDTGGLEVIEQHFQVLLDLLASRAALVRG